MILGVFFVLCLYNRRNGMVSEEHARVGSKVLRRRELHMIQKEVSGVSGSSIENITAMEHGTSNFTVKSLMKISEALRTDYRELIKLRSI